MLQTCRCSHQGAVSDSGTRTLSPCSHGNAEHAYPMSMLHSPAEGCSTTRNISVSTCTLLLSHLCHPIAPPVPVPPLATASWWLDLDIYNTLLDFSPLWSLTRLLAKLDVSTICTLFLLISSLIPWLNNRSWQSKETCAAASAFWWADSKRAASVQQTHLNLLGKVRRADFQTVCTVQGENLWERKGKSCKRNLQGFAFHSIPLLMYRRDLKSKENHTTL